MERTLKEAVVVAYGRTGIAKAKRAVSALPILWTSPASCWKACYRKSPS